MVVVTQVLLTATAQTKVASMTVMTVMMEVRPARYCSDEAVVVVAEALV